jgi:hypothetical protein
MHNDDVSCSSTKADNGQKRGPDQAEDADGMLDLPSILNTLLEHKAKPEDGTGPWSCQEL